MIKIENINKNFGGQTIFKDFSFGVNKGEKIGLIGRNGHGKTTLFKMITGEIEPESGNIVVPKNYKIGYLQQHISFSQNTILEEATLGLPTDEQNNDWKAKRILSGLGFSSEDFYKNPNIFSGGFQIRLNLAKVLLSEPNLLLLDEPNNYLDIVAIRWLSNFLRSWKNEIMLITHDRNFMDGIISHTVFIHRQKAKKIEGTTEKLYEQVEQEEEIYEKTRQNEEKKRKQTEIFISKFRAKARLAGMVQSRIKSLEKTDVKDQLEKIESLDFSFNYSGFNAQQLLEANDISFSYKKDDNPKIIQKFSLTIDKNQRIAIIGKNGRGKSTLLKLLTGILTPDSGKIARHNNVKSAYFGQTNLENLVQEKTILDELLASDPDNSIQKARNVAGQMMFSGDAALKKIKILSGGEKNRVMLGKILLTPSNLLFLDEPTNHLDLDSTDALLEAILDFPGAVVMVTHNEMYLNNFANTLVIFDDDEIKIFYGTYQEFLEKIGWQSEREELQLKSNKQKNLDKNVYKKDLKKKKAEIINAKSKILVPINEKIAEIEKTLESQDKELENLNHDLITASEAKNIEIIKNNSQKIGILKKIIDENYKTLDELYKNLESETQKFKEMLNNF